MSTTQGVVEPGRRVLIPGPAQTVDDVVRLGARQRPRAEALVGANGRYTYAGLDREVERVACFLVEQGVGPGDRVAASLPNRPDIVVAFLAAMRLGAVWVGLNRKLAPAEKSSLLGDCGPAVLLAERPAPGDAPAGSPDPRCTVVEVDEGEPSCAWAGRPVRKDRPPDPIDPFAPAAIAYTSGTTARPKGVVHSQHNIVLVGAANAGLGLWRRDLRQGAVLALTMLNVMALCPLLAFQLGGTCICVERPDPVGLAATVEEERIESFSSVPTILYDLVNSPEVHPSQLATLRNVGVGGQACPEETKAAYRRLTGWHVCASYGLTEAPTALTTQAPGEPAPPGSTGRALPHIDVTIRAGDGTPLGNGEVGEICAGPVTHGRWAGVYTPFLGYWGRPGATRSSLADGLLHTGDLGSMDPDGHLFVHDRMSDLIVRGGANVRPAEIERVLADDPEVAGVAVVGEPDPRLGERIVAYVEPAPGVESPSPEALRTRCAGHLARYERPDEIRVVDGLPRNAMGKVLKWQLGSQQPDAGDRSRPPRRRGP